MRYYTIQVLNSDGSLYTFFTSYFNGQTDLGALQVQFDVPIYGLAQPASATSVKVWGVDLYTISQAKNFADKTIKVYAGFQSGLPLANLALQSGHTGLIFQGTIYQAFGNWVGVNQWLELMILPTDLPIAATTNIAFQWSPGQSIQSALNTTLTTAFGSGYKITFAISANLATTEVVTHTSDTLTAFAQYIEQLTQPIVGKNYTGVQIYPQPNALLVFDNTQPLTTKTIYYTDMIGQPTWVDVNTIQATLSMRADLSPGMTLTLPVSQVVSESGVVNRFNNPAAFQGSFTIQSVRHIGDFRQPDAMAWITVVDCYSNLTVS